MQICKKMVLFFAFLILFITILFAQIAVPSVSAPTISGPTAPTVPSFGNQSNGFTTTTTTTTNSTQKMTTDQETLAGIDLTSDALSTLSGIFGTETSSMTDIYSLLGEDLNYGENGEVDNLVLEQILTKLESIEVKLAQNTITENKNDLIAFRLTNYKTNDMLNLLDKAQNISVSNNSSNGFLLSGTIKNSDSSTETFYIDFKLLNTHTYEASFSVHTTNENSILKEIASNGPYKASKTADFITMSVFGPEHYLDLVLVTSQN